MKTLFSFACIALFFVSCGNTKKLKVGEINSLQFEYSPGAEINYGGIIEARIKAIMHNGEELDITNHRKLDFSSEGVNKSGKTFKITHHPLSFDENYVTISMTVSDKEETFEARDTIYMNFLGGLLISAPGDYGEDGEDQKDRGDRILLRDGKEGYVGANGQPGFAGGNYEAYIWKEGDLYYVYARELNTLQVWRYKTYATRLVSFDISGGQGGDGGDGGGGGDGKDGSKDEDGKIKRPGAGGNGGNGGHGANGGNGGNLHLIIHPNASDISSQLKYDVSGGPGGEGGKGGKGGNPGEAISGQAGGSKGANGRQGGAGNWGLNGSTNVEFKEFDSIPLKQ